MATNKTRVIQLVTAAQQSLTGLPAGRVDSVQGAVDFQRDVKKWRARFASFVWALQDDDETEAERLLQEMENISRQAKNLYYGPVANGKGE